MTFLHQAVVFLGGAVVAVLLFKKLGLGSVLGYLAAGVALGPEIRALIAEKFPSQTPAADIAHVGPDVEAVLHFSEFGVVLLLFLIGLELQPSRLWALRKSVFGLGSLQVAGTGLVLAVIAIPLGLPVSAALIAGLGLALSSTAFALQLLSEKNQLTAEHGRAAFGILLFQDLAVIPILAALPFLGVAPEPSTEPGWMAAAKVFGALSLVVVLGRFALRPVFAAIARQHSQELFTASALFVVVGTAVLMEQAGLSAPLGAFLAGVLLAESEYRHELETDIEPFKGLLLGLFFMAIGMSVKLKLLASQPGTVALLVVGLTLVKVAVLYGIGKWKKYGTKGSLVLGVSISQGGEFAFVLFGLAVKFQVMERNIADLLIGVVSASMAVTPILYMVMERLVFPKLVVPEKKRDFDSIDESNPVIIAGFGRVGQVVGRVLAGKKIGFTALDASPDHVDFLRKFGNRIFYGDASRLDMLKTAGADKATVFVLAIDDVESSLKTAKTVQEHFPHLKIYARARNRQHAYALLGMGITHLNRETFASSAEMTADILQALGLSFSDAQATVGKFREYDEQLLLDGYKHRDNMAVLQARAAGARAELEKLFAEDAKL